MGYGFGVFAAMIVAILVITMGSIWFFINLEHKHDMERLQFISECKNDRN